MVFTYERFDNAYAGHILLYHSIEYIILLENQGEHLRHLADNQGQNNAENHTGNDENET